MDGISSNGTTKGALLASDLGACFSDHWEKKRLWIGRLREEGIKGAIFSSAWVDTTRKTVYFCETSLIFNDGLDVGDEMILGDWFSQCSLIRLTSKLGDNTYGYEIAEKSWTFR